MEGTEQQSPFAQTIGRLAPQGEGTTIDTTTALEGTTVDTTTTPEGATTDTTQVPEGTTSDTTEAPAEVTVIDELRTQYGVEDVLENSVEGLQALIEKVTTKTKVDAIKEKFETRPILGQLDAHLEAGKSLESFFEVKAVESQKIEVPVLTGEDKADAEAKSYYKEVMKANYKATGLSDKQISRIIESSELENTLYEDAKEAADSWNKRLDIQAASISQQEEQQRLQSIEDDKRIIASINTILDGGTINGAVIPAADREAMKTFTLKTDDKGFTARDIAFSKLTLEKQLLIDYLVFKDFNIKGFVAAAPKGTSLDTIRKNPLANNEGGGGGNAAETKPLPSNIRTLDFRTLARNGQEVQTL